MPCDPESMKEVERGVLGSLISDPDRWLPVAEPILDDGRIFFYEQNRAILSAIVRLGQAACLTNLTTSLVGIKNPATYLSQCMDDAYPTEAQFRYGLELLVSAAHERADESAGKKFLADLKKDPNQARAAMIEHLTVARPGIASPGLPGQVSTAADLMNTDLGETRWAADGLLPEGLTLLVGRPKVGKSWLVLDLGNAIASGGTALGRINVERGSVLLLSLEDTDRRMQRRLGHILNGEPAPTNLHYATRWPRLHEGGITAIEAWIQRHPDARFVSVDTLARVRPPGRPNASLYAEDYAALTGLKSLADHYGVSIVATHHERKLAAEDWVDGVSGTTGLTGSADTILALHRRRGTNEARLRGEGRDLAEPIDLALQWDQSFGTWSIIGEGALHLLTQEQRDIVRTIRSFGRCAAPPEVAAALMIKVDTAKHRMWRMEAQGKLTVTEQGQYGLPEGTEGASPTSFSSPVSRVSPVTR